MILYRIRMAVVISFVSFWGLIHCAYTQLSHERALRSRMGMVRNLAQCRTRVNRLICDQSKLKRVQYFSMQCGNTQGTAKSSYYIVGYSSTWQNKRVLAFQRCAPWKKRVCALWSDDALAFEWLLIYHHKRTWGEQRLMHINNMLLTLLSLEFYLRFCSSVWAVFGRYGEVTVIVVAISIVGCRASLANTKSAGNRNWTQNKLGLLSSASCLWKP